MSKTMEVCVTATFDTEAEYEAFVDAVLELAHPHDGAAGGVQWEHVPDDDDGEGIT